MKIPIYAIISQNQYLITPSVFLLLFLTSCVSEKRSPNTFPLEFLKNGENIKITKGSTDGIAAIQILYYGKSNVDSIEYILSLQNRDSVCYVIKNCYLKGSVLSRNLYDFEDFNIIKSELKDILSEIPYFLNRKYDPLIK